MRSRMRALSWARARVKIAQLNDSYFLFFEFLMGSVMGISKLYQYITRFNLINITIKNIAINTGRLWRRPVLGQSEIVCTVGCTRRHSYQPVSRALVGAPASTRVQEGCARSRGPLSHCWTHLWSGVPLYFTFECTPNRMEKLVSDLYICVWKILLHFIL